MHKSTISSPAAMCSTDKDCVASQYNITHKTPTCTYTTHCGRPGCPTVFVYDDATDWPTVNCLVDNHYPICTGRFYELAPSHPPTNTQSSQHAPSAQLGPESWGANTTNRDNDIIAGSSKRRQKEDERKETLKNDEYTDDVQPTSVRCRGCNKVICLDKRSRYYPGLWVKHRGKCPGILKLENDKLTSGTDWFGSSDPEGSPATGEYSEEDSGEDEDKVMGFKSVVDGSKHHDPPRTLVRLHNACWE